MELEIKEYWDAASEYRSERADLRVNGRARLMKIALFGLGAPALSAISDLASEGITIVRDIPSNAKQATF